MQVIARIHPWTQDRGDRFIHYGTNKTTERQQEQFFPTFQGLLLAVLD